MRNNSKTVDECVSLSPDHLVIGPGPGTPSRAGISLALIRRFSGKIPILGVCLGHQAIAEAFGGRIIQSSCPIHGKSHHIYHSKKSIFSNVTSPFLATRYHSLAIEKETLPAVVEVTAETKDQTIMGIRHRTHPTEGVQFHPESITTESGMQILQNFLTQSPSIIKENDNEITRETDPMRTIVPERCLMCKSVQKSHQAAAS